MAENDNKPKTIPEALELSDRKVEAIYGTVEEIFKTRTTIEALVEMRSMYPDQSELTFALYAFSFKVGAAKAKAKEEDNINETFVKGQMVGIMTNLPMILDKLERAGIITVNDPSELTRQVKKNKDNLPDDILFG